MHIGQLSVSAGDFSQTQSFAAADSPGDCNPVGDLLRGVLFDPPGGIYGHSITNAGLAAIAERPCVLAREKHDTSDDKYYPAVHYAKYHISADTLRQQARRGHIRSRKSGGNRNHYSDADVRRVWPQLFDAS
jgi:hypothetical protein